MPRGALQFETTDDGDLVNSASNVETLRQLWLHHTLVTGEDLGPGDRGDFDVGAWHVACHLAGAGGLRVRPDGTRVWLEISHDRGADEYFASGTFKQDGSVVTRRLDSAEGRLALRDSTLAGFVEGTSTGRISARDVLDPPDRFRLWRRQDFDQPIDTTVEGGRVWEHWCTLRDIRSTHRIGTSMLTAFVALAAALGDRFVPTVARGRRDYGHPVQLVAMVHAGLTAKTSALWDVQPTPIPAGVIPLMLEGQPAQSLEAADRLDWSNGPRYHMFERKIADWSSAAAVRQDLIDFAP